MSDYVHQHYHRPISLDELASAMKRNASYLSALFSRTTGVTFHQFLEEVRLSKARELLRDPRNRVGKVARAAGYANPDSFRHAFKSHEGLSPEALAGGMLMNLNATLGLIAQIQRNVRFSKTLSVAEPRHRC